MVKVVQHDVSFKWMTPNILEEIESATRTCYKSEDKICEGSAEKIFNQVVKQSHHDSVSEHGVISIHVNATDRATLGQITRHRLFSFSVESQRYCNYTKDKFGNEVLFVQPVELPDVDSDGYFAWHTAMVSCESIYFSMIKDMKIKPEVARSVLPNSTKTEFRITGNVRVWRNFFKLRMSKHAQADIRHLANLIYDEMINNGVPSILFDDIIPFTKEELENA